MIDSRLVRRYILLRRRELGSTASRWSMERIPPPPAETRPPAGPPHRLPAR